MRQKQSVKNLIYGILSFIVTTILSVLIPRLFLLSYGSEMNGLINSVKQIFSYFLLLEAGIGGAARQALYGPMAKQDRGEISAIMAATDSFYKRTGLFYAGFVIALAIIYPLIVHSDIATPIIVSIILLQGEAGVVKYLITGKLQLLIQVDGNNYVLSNIGTAFSVVSNFARIALLSLGFGVLWVQSVFCIVDLLQVAIIVSYFQKKYGWVNFKEKPNVGALAQRNNVLVHQISGLIFNNTDTIILSVFCGLKTVSVYAMYMMLYGLVANIIGYVSSSVSFAMGQLLNSDKKRFEKIQECYETYYLALSFSLFAVANIFILPFLRLYTNGVTDINYIDAKLPLLFLIIQLLNYGRNTSGSIIDYAGHYKQTQYRSLLETVINITVSLIGVYFFGIYGVLVGTIAALLYRTNDMIIYANHTVMERSCISTYRRWIRNILLTFISVNISRILPVDYTGYVELMCYVAVVSIAVILIFISINTIIEQQARQVASEYLRGILSSRFHKK